MLGLGCPWIDLFVANLTKRGHAFALTATAFLLQAYEAGQDEEPSLPGRCGVWSSNESAQTTSPEGAVFAQRHKGECGGFTNSAVQLLMALLFLSSFRPIA